MDMECSMQEAEEMLTKKLESMGYLVIAKHLPALVQLQVDGLGMIRIYRKKDGTSSIDDTLLKKKSILSELLGRPEIAMYNSDIIGVDESGKGDYFGPLVIAAVYIDTPDKEKELFNLGVRDSKKVAEKKAIELAAMIRQKCVHAEIVLMPEEYNERYSEHRNLNSLLAWGHARAIENILEKSHAKTAISDKFADDKMILSKLMAKGKGIQLIQRTKAEQNTAVAAASIVARAEFLKQMQNLSDRYGILLPRGAGDAVKQTAQKLIQKYGKDEIKKLAKLHFSISGIS